MKVFVTSTLEIQSSEVEKVTNLLNKIPGELTFIPLVSLAPEVFKHYEKKFQNPVEVEPLSFQEFFNLIDFHRDMNASSNISPDDFFVIITSIKNEKKWFSSYQNRDVFINTLSWEKYTKNKPELGIAHQIVENIFQSFLGVDVFNVKDDPNIHEEQIGCINDLCSNKAKIILKIRTGFICDTCLDSYINKGNDKKIILHIHKLINSIRKDFVNLDKICNDINLYNNVIVRKDGIQFGEKVLKLHELEMTMYIYFLQHSDGVKRSDFKTRETKQEIVNSYQNFNKLSDFDSIEKVCKSIEDGTNYFSKMKSQINKKLEDLLGVEIAVNYQIISKGTIHRINQGFNPNSLLIEL